MKCPLQHTRKIAVLRALQVGDMICTVPALRALHAACPNAEITLLGLPWAQALTKRYPVYIHRFIHFPGYPGLPEQEFDAATFLSFLHHMQHEKYDVVLQMQGNGSFVNPMIQLFGARQTSGFYLPGNYCPDTSLYCIYPGRIHEIDRHLALMRHLGIEHKGRHLEFPLYERDYEDYSLLDMSLSTTDYVCIHPGARGKWRRWPVGYFAALANACAEQGLTVVITGTTDEMEIVAELCTHLDFTPVIAAGNTTLGSMAVLLKNARLLISNCTGVSHIAAALEVPSLVISMDGEPERWMPLNKKLHHTIDWTQQPALSKVQAILEDSLARLMTGR